MSELKPINNEKKPSVALTTNSFITETYKNKNESDYQNEHAFSDINIQDSLSGSNNSETVILECAGRTAPYPVGAGGQAFVALNENREIIYAAFEPEQDEEGTTQYLTDFFAVYKALKWALSLPKETKIIVSTDSKLVAEFCLPNCECDNDLVIESKVDLFKLMRGNRVHSINLISKENNKAADFAKFALETSIKILEGDYENEADYEE